MLVAIGVLSVAGCDTITQGYINRLPYGITIVEHPGPSKNPFTLAPQQIDPPGFGRNPSTFDVFTQGRRLVGSYRSRDLAVSGHGSFRYVVIDEQGAHMETREEISR